MVIIVGMDGNNQTNGNGYMIILMGTDGQSLKRGQTDGRTSIYLKRHFVCISQLAETYHGIDQLISRIICSGYLQIQISSTKILFYSPKLLVGLSLSAPATSILELDKDSFLVRLEMVRSLEETCRPAMEINIYNLYSNHTVDSVVQCCRQGQQVWGLGIPGFNWTPDYS